MEMNHRGIDSVRLVTCDMENVSGKLIEEESVDFKKRQRRRSSITPLAVAGHPKPSLSSGRRASTVSSTSSWCEYPLKSPHSHIFRWIQSSAKHSDGNVYFGFTAFTADFYSNFTLVLWFLLNAEAVFPFVVLIFRRI